MKRNLSCFIITCLLFLIFLSVPLAAEKYPAREIQLILATAPGGFVDTSVRLMVDILGKNLGVPVIMNHRTGAGGATGTQFLVRSKPDGYTIGCLASRDLVIVPATVPNLPYKRTDLDPLCKYVSDRPVAIICKANAPWNTLEELVADAKKRPGQITYGATTNAVTYFQMEEFLMAAGIEMVHVPLPDAGQTTIRILGGNLDVGVTGISSPIATMGQLKAGTIRALAIASPERDSSFPQIPTLREKGFNVPVLTLYNGFFAPLGMPKPIREILEKALEKTINDPTLKKKLEEVLLLLDYLPSEGLAKQLEEDYRRVAELTKTLKPQK